MVSATVLVSISLFIMLISLYGILQPLSVIAWVRRIMTGKSGLWVAVLVRVAFAALLWFAAPLSRTPLICRVLAVLALTAAAVLPVMGVQGIQRLMNGVTRWPLLIVRLWFLFGTIFGGFLLWSISSPVLTVT